MDGKKKRKKKERNVYIQKVGVDAKEALSQKEDDGSVPKSLSAFFDAF